MGNDPLEQPKLAGWRLVAPAEPAVEETALAYRLALDLKPGETRTLSIDFEQPREETYRVGDFTDAPPGRHGVPMEAVLRERLAQLRVPVVAGFPAGHGIRNAPLHLGMSVTIDGGTGVVEFGEP